MVLKDKYSSLGCRDGAYRNQSEQKKEANISPGDRGSTRYLNISQKTEATAKINFFSVSERYYGASTRLV